MCYNYIYMVVMALHWCLISADKSGSNNYLVISSVTVTPDPPRRGKLLNITVDYTLSE